MVGLQRRLCTADSTGRCNTLIAAEAAGVLQMKYRTRVYYSDAQKAVMWERWKQGWTLHQIAQLFNRAHTSVQGILARTGGIRPPSRTRASTSLTLAEREEISRAMAEGHSIRSLPLNSGELLRRSAASSVAMEGERAIERAMQTALPGLAPFAPSAAN